MPESESTTTTTVSADRTSSIPLYRRKDNYPTAPVPPQDLSIKTIRDAVPAHCFERSLLTSLKHLAIDLLMISAMAFAIHWLDNNAVSRLGLPQFVLSFVLWPLYWWWQGAVMTGVWVLAHECGHQAFSPWKSVNDAFGLVLHSALLVPYHSWRITHSQHHKKTNHMTMDQVFVPSNKQSYDALHGISTGDNGIRKYRLAIQHALEETPLGDLFGIFQMCAFGWWAYLAANIASQPDELGANHYNPKSPLFSKRDYWDIVVSDIGIVAAIAAISACVHKFGLANVVYYYFIPYLFVNMWLVIITYLQHSDPAIPHYTPKAFSFVRGALCSIDRDYGVYNVLHHHIGDTHVAHHMFSQMPFYHAQEATEAIKKVLGEYYYNDNTPVFQALRRSWAYCKYVDEKDGDVMFYHNYRMELAEAKER